MLFAHICMHSNGNTEKLYYKVNGVIDKLQLVVIPEKLIGMHGQDS